MHEQWVNSGHAASRALATAAAWLLEGGDRHLAKVAGATACTFHDGACIKSFGDFPNWRYLFLGCPYAKDCSTLGSTLGSPYLGELHIM